MTRENKPPLACKFGIAVAPQLSQALARFSFSPTC